MRLGWLHAHPRTVERAWTNTGVMGSGGALNPIGSLIANQMLSDGSLTAHLASLRATFAMDVKVIKRRFQSKRAQRYIRLQLFSSTLK